MTRRYLYPIVSFSGLLLCSASYAAKKPNILFILADDLSYRDLSCFGQQRYKTPNLDSLAQHSVRFTQAYSAAPESAPSRCSLLTGLHTGHSSVRINSSARGQDNLLDSDITVAEALKDAGYRTAFTGKWGVGIQGTEGVPYKQGFDYSFGFYDQTEAHSYIPDYLFENERQIFYPQNEGFDMWRRYQYKGNTPQNRYDSEGRLMISELKDPYGYAYSENEIQKATMKFLSEHHSMHKESPFFLYYATQLPHGPVIVDQMGDMLKPDSVNQLSREWAAMVIKLDNFVGVMTNYLKSIGEYDNTIILFASDNGYSMCGYTDRGNAPHWHDDPWLKNKGPFTGGKFTVQEGGVRIPFFVSCPTRFPTQVISTPVWLPDFFPTATDVAGLGSDYCKTDGRSLLPLLENRHQDYSPHHHLYFSRGAEQALRIGAFSAYREKRGAKIKLYLIQEDTFTERDLSAIYPDVAKEAETIMDNSFTPHPWYRTPDETDSQYRIKLEKAKQTNNILPIYRPNGITKFPWER